jgi:hypothetical protein
MYCSYMSNISKPVVSSVPAAADKAVMRSGSDGSRRRQGVNGATAPCFGLPMMVPFTAWLALIKKRLILHSASPNVYVFLKPRPQSGPPIEFVAIRDRRAADQVGNLPASVVQPQHHIGQGWLLMIAAAANMMHRPVCRPASR